MSSNPFLLSDEQMQALRQKYPHFNQPWTEEETASFKDLYNQGLTQAQLSERFGRSPGAIREKAKALNLMRPTPGRPWTATDDGLLVQLYGEEIPFGVMATRLDRSVYAVVHRLVTLRIDLFGNTGH